MEKTMTQLKKNHMSARKLRQAHEKGYVYGLTKVGRRGEKGKGWTVPWMQHVGQPNFFSHAIQQIGDTARSWSNAMNDRRCTCIIGFKCATGRLLMVLLQLRR